MIFVVDHPQLLLDPINLVIPGFLEVERADDRDVKMRHMNLTLDGEQLATMDWGYKIVAPLRPGPHVLKIDNTMQSRTVRFESRAGETVSIYIGHTAGMIAYALIMAIGISSLKVFVECDDPNVKITKN